jgi:PTH2 family peptidyl-tRNA hydrolase
MADLERQIKQIIVIRKDLKLRRGKEISQASHASMMWLVNRLGFRASFFKRLWIALKLIFMVNFSKEEVEWLTGSFTKVCVRVDSEEALMEVVARAKGKNIEAWVVTDAGRTEFHGVPTVTACAIGPDHNGKIDEITGQLELY